MENIHSGIIAGRTAVSPGEAFAALADLLLDGLTRVDRFIHAQLPSTIRSGAEATAIRQRGSVGHCPADDGAEIG